MVEGARLESVYDLRGGECLDILCRYADSLPGDDWGYYLADGELQVLGWEMAR